MTDHTTKRKPVNLATASNTLVALCDDGTMWALPPDNSGWKLVAPVPNNRLDFSGEPISEFHKNLKPGDVVTLKEHSRVSHKIGGHYRLTDKDCKVRFCQFTSDCYGSVAIVDFMDDQNAVGYVQKHDLVECPKND